MTNEARNEKAKLNSLGRQQLPPSQTNKIAIISRRLVTPRRKAVSLRKEQSRYGTFVVKAVITKFML